MHRVERVEQNWECVTRCKKVVRVPSSVTPECAPGLSLSKVESIERGLDAPP